MPLLYGLDKELAQKAEEKYDIEKENQVRRWIEEVIEEEFPHEDFFESLKNGAILCKLASKLTNTEIKYKMSRIPFKQMENINNFLVAAESLGCPRHDLFQTIDLYERKNPNQVIDAMFSVSRHAASKGWNGATIGPKLATKRQVEFSNEQLQQSNAIIGRQAGYPMGASQSGMGSGRRDITSSGVGTGCSGSVSLQMGSAKGASQAGMSYGARREIDCGVGAGSPDVASKQMGSNLGASQSGMSYGSRREINPPASVASPISASQRTSVNDNSIQTTPAKKL